MVKKTPNPKAPVPAPNGEIDWEMRPGGMLVQRRDDDDDAASAAAAAAAASASARGPMIRIDVAHGPNHHEIFVPAHSTFGEIKNYLAQKTGVEPNEQKLLFRGKEKDDEEHLHDAGVKDNAKVQLVEDRKPEEKKVEELNESNEVLGNAGEAGGDSSNGVPSNGGDVGGKSKAMSKGAQAIAEVRAEVDKLAERVAALEVAVGGGTKVSDKEFAVATELLMRQLLKLDGIPAEGEERMQRKAEVRRIQSFVDALDALKAKNSNPVNTSSNAASVTTKWETFDSGVGCLSAPTPMPSSTEGNQDWERFQ